MVAYFVKMAFKASGSAFGFLSKVITPLISCSTSVSCV